MKSTSKEIIKKYSMIVIIFIVFVFCIAYSLFAGSTESSGSISLYVGEESVEFYQKTVNKYLETVKVGGKLNPNDTESVESNPKHPNIIVKPADGNYAGQFQTDPENGADIFWIAQDGLSKLTAGAGLIAPFNDLATKNQIVADNTKETIDLITLNKQIYGAPYISQAMVLYYNKSLVSSSDVTSWDKLLEVSQKSNIKAFTIPEGGNNGYHSSLFFLTTEIVENKQPRPIVKFYTNLQDREDDSTPFRVTGLDSTEFKKISEYAQNLFSLGFANNTDYSSSIQNKKALSLISGSWHAETVKKALGGEANVGVTILPQFYIDNKTYQTGSWTDVKIFCMKKTSTNLKYLQPIVKYLTSWEVQQESFLEVDNLPSHKDTLNKLSDLKASYTGEGKEFKFSLAEAQLKMQSYGRPQPFGQAATLLVNNKELTLSSCYYEGGAFQLWIEYLMKDSKLELSQVLKLLKRKWEEGIPVNQPL